MVSRYNNKNWTAELEQFVSDIICSSEIPTCMHYDSPTNCDGRIIKAHSIQRAEIVKSINPTNGRVLQSLNPDDPLSDALNLITAKQATTFRGFCSKHDSLFDEIENKNFNYTYRHCNVASYRIICRELYFHKRNENAVNSLFGWMDKHGFQPHPNHRDKIKALLSGLALTSRVFEKLKIDMDSYFIQNHYNYHHYIIEFKTNLPVLFGACFFPEWDFVGRFVQDVNSLMSKFHSLVFSIIPSGDHYTALFSWHNRDHEAMSEFVNSLIKTNIVSNKIIQMMFEHTDNNVFSDSFMSQFDDHELLAIINIKKHGLDLTKTRSWDCLSSDLIRSAEWEIVQGFLVE